MSTWQNVGAFWHSKKGSKAKVYGTITVDGKKLKVSLFENTEKQGNQPDFRLVAAPDAEWEVDEYAQRRQERDTEPEHWG